MQKKLISLSFNSLIVKTTIIYVLLALLTITVITSLIFENQSDLIVKNTVLEAEKTVYMISGEIQKVFGDSPGEERAGLVASAGRVLDDLKFERWVIMNEEADILAVRPESIRTAIKEKDEFMNINRAMFKKENQGKLFYAQIADTPLKLREQKIINFYIPIPYHKTRSLILKVPVAITGIEHHMAMLYRQCAVLIAGMVLIVIGIALVYNRMVIRPVMRLSRASKQVAEGDYKVSVKTASKDEIGDLYQAFNHMVRSLDSTTSQLRISISELEEYHKIIEYELDIARRIQEGMLPTTFYNQRISFSAYYQALEKISGDFYDVIEFSDGSIGIIIADVSGHGIPAALITIMVKFLFYTYAPLYKDPAELFAKMNLDLSRTQQTGNYVTTFYLIIDTENRVRCANAGHHPPYVYRRETGQIEEFTTEGLIMGITATMPEPYQENTFTLRKGDRIILYTDGITEQSDPEKNRYREERLMERIRDFANEKVEIMVSNIIEDVNRFARSSKRFDDYTLIAIEINTDPAENAALTRQTVPIIEEESIHYPFPLPADQIDGGVESGTALETVPVQTGIIKTRAPYVRFDERSDNSMFLDIPATIDDGEKSDGQKYFIRIKKDAKGNLAYAGTFRIDPGILPGREPGGDIAKQARISIQNGEIQYIEVPKQIISRHFQKKFRDENSYLKIMTK